MIRAMLCKSRYHLPSKYMPGCWLYERLAAFAPAKSAGTTPKMPTSRTTLHGSSSSLKDAAFQIRLACALGVSSRRTRRSNAREPMTAAEPA
jgi:hypothetical protein